MKLFILLLSIFLFVACKKDNGFGRIYEFSGYTQNNQGIYLVLSNENFSDLPLTSGSHGKDRGLTWMDALQSFLFVFDLRKIEIIGDSTISISYYSENLPGEVLLPFNRNQVLVDIPNIEGETLVYNKEEDKFTLCGVTYYFLPGVNSNHLNSKYDTYFLQSCNLGDPVNEYIFELITEYELQELDTIDIISNELFYSN